MKIYTRQQINAKKNIHNNFVNAFVIYYGTNEHNSISNGLACILDYGKKYFLYYSEANMPIKKFKTKHREYEDTAHNIERSCDKYDKKNT